MGGGGVTEGREGEGKRRGTATDKKKTLVIYLNNFSVFESETDALSVYDQVQSFLVGAIPQLIKMPFHSTNSFRRFLFGLCDLYVLLKGRRV